MQIFLKVALQDCFSTQSRPRTDLEIGFKFTDFDHAVEETLGRLFSALFCARVVAQGEQQISVES